MEDVMVAIIEILHVIHSENLAILSSFCSKENYEKLKKIYDGRFTEIIKKFSKEEKDAGTSKT